MERQMWITVAWWIMFFYSLAVSSYGGLMTTISTMSIVTSIIGMLMVGTIWGAYLWEPKAYHGKSIDYGMVFFIEFLGCLAFGLLCSIVFYGLDLIYAIFLYYPILISEGLIILWSYYSYKSKTI